MVLGLFCRAATVRLLLLFVTPFYVLVAIAFGDLDPLFLTPVSEYSPLRWNSAAVGDAVGLVFTSGSVYQGAFIRALIYVAVATILCLGIGWSPTSSLGMRVGGGLCS
jgi:ABC-type spermidine/putrescine transport system permease subunit I